MKKPSIIILMHYMELGGAESAMLGMLLASQPERAEIDVFIYDHRGELMEYIPTDKVNLLPQIKAYSLLERPIKQVVKAGYLNLAVARFWGRRDTKRYQKYNVNKLDNATGFLFQGRRTVKCMPKINPGVEYDLAISFITPHYITLEKVKAKKKIGWIHTDYTNIFINPKMELEMWSRLDYIVSISQDVSRKFIEVFPTLENKIIEVENILSSKFIRLRADSVTYPSDISKEEGVLKLLTIGRFCNPKKMEEIPAICRIIRENGINVCWYIIGYGSEYEEKKIRKAIVDNTVQDNVIILGKKSNPYPYIKTCDIYVQPSRYEGKSITVREAQILCKPVIVTAYPTAASQINNGVDGIIVPMPIEECATAMTEFIRDSEKQERLVSYLSCHDYGNEDEIEKIYKLVE